MATIFYAGDSTVTFNKIDSYPQSGMSQGMLRYLKDSVRMRSLARNGRSTKSFIDEGLLDVIDSEIREGDFLFVQFGHNDEKADRERHTDPETTFPDNLMKFARTAWDHGAYPVFITPIARRLFDVRGRFLPGSHGAYPEAVRRTGRKYGVPVADLTTVTERWLAAVGDTFTRPFFMWPGDNTHLKPEGAVLMAGFLCDELQKMGPPYSGLLVSRIPAAENEGLDVS